MMIKIKPFYTAIIFYFVANLLFFTLAISDNTVTIEYETFYVDNFMGEISKIFFQNDLKNGYNLLRYGIISR